MLRPAGVYGVVMIPTGREKGHMVLLHLTGVGSGEYVGMTDPLCLHLYR